MKTLVTSFTLIVFGLVTFAAGARWGPWTYSQLPLCVLGLEVLDGDTINCEGRKVRLAGYDTPETLAFNAPAACKESSISLGLIARDFLAEHVEIARRSGNLSLSPILKRNSFWTEVDRFGRPLAQIHLNGVDAGDLLKAKGYAHEWSGTGPKPDWCALIGQNPQLQQEIQRR